MILETSQKVFLIRLNQGTWFRTTGIVDVDVDGSIFEAALHLFHKFAPLSDIDGKIAMTVALQTVNHPREFVLGTG